MRNKFENTTHLEEYLIWFNNIENTTITIVTGTSVVITGATMESFAS